MTASKSANALRELINKAIEDHILTPDEHDQIIALATEDGIIDPEEQALLEQLREMIETKVVRIRPNN